MGRSRASKEQMGMKPGVLSKAKGGSCDGGNLPKSMGPILKKKENLVIRRKSDQSH